MVRNLSLLNMKLARNGLLMSNILTALLYINFYTTGILILMQLIHMQGSTLILFIISGKRDTCQVKAQWKQNKDQRWNGNSRSFTS